MPCAVWKKLHLINSLAKGAHKELSSIDLKLIMLRAQLQRVQEELLVQLYDDGLIKVERDLLLQIHKWNGIHDKILRQKSRATWIAYVTGIQSFSMLTLDLDKLEIGLVSSVITKVLD